MEIQVHKLWTKVYSQKGLTAMEKHTFFAEPIHHVQGKMKGFRGLWPWQFELYGKFPWTDYIQYGI